MMRQSRSGDGAWVLAVALAVCPLQLGCATGTGDDTAGSSGVASDSGMPSPSPSPSGSGAPTNGYGYTGDSAAPPASMPVEMDAGVTSPPTGSSTGMCSNDPKYLLELFTTMDAGACPCGASECCFSGLVCLPI